MTCSFAGVGDGVVRKSPFGLSDTPRMGREGETRAAQLNACVPEVYGVWLGRLFNIMGQLLALW
ncbi:hypothetical protein DSLASN_09880 [Desulfoluna limicola]|uniref:Uncharacterized protein n=1 Tax=Desulfoluna limicola TaxID=2810562 RepID=A0ABM7PDS2_9BACT|nr:hypothetical protein DSLASN_09880 [Desulfoluna limicola]